MDSNLKKLITVYSVVTLALLFITVYGLIPSNVSNETSSYLETQHSSSAKVGARVQNPELISKKLKGEKITDKSKEVPAMTLSRFRSSPPKLLSRLGSSPPKCIAKCGHCSPCKPTRMIIHPPQYHIDHATRYPVAWKCKCSNKLYYP